MKIKITANTVLVFAAYFIAVVMLGMVSWINAGFSLEFLQSSKFLFDMGLTSLAYLIILINTVLAQKRKAEESNKDVQYIIRWINEVFAKRVMRKTLNEYLYKVNMETKTIAWKSYIEYKLERLERYKTANDEAIHNGSDENAKRKNKYCRKVAHYERLVSPEYIAKHINHVRVKYEHLTVKMLYGASSKYSQSDKYTKASKQMFSDLAPRFFFSWAMTIFIASFTYTFNVLDASTIINTLAKLFGLLSQIINGINYGDQYVKEYTLKDLQQSKGYLEDYLSEYKMPNVEV